jgi:hypothetical protein
MYAPLLPFIGLASNIITFYVKKLLALYLYTPPKERYSASRTNVLVYTLMLGAHSPNIPSVRYEVSLDAMIRLSLQCSIQLPKLQQASILSDILADVSQSVRPVKVIHAPLCGLTSTHVTSKS